MLTACRSGFLDASEKSLPTSTDLSPKSFAARTIFPYSSCSLLASTDSDGSTLMHTLQPKTLGVRVCGSVRKQTTLHCLLRKSPRWYGPGTFQFLHEHFIP